MDGFLIRNFFKSSIANVKLKKWKKLHKFDMIIVTDPTEMQAIIKIFSYSF